MTLRWRPTPDEERWLEVAADLGDAVPRDALADRSGGWRRTGKLARIALFVLGFLAALLLLGLFGFNDETTLLIAGLVALTAAEWLVLTKQLHASGIEEGLCVAGSLLVAGWLATKIGGGSGFAGGRVEMLVLIGAGGLAGLRLLNPLVTTGAVIALVDWVGGTLPAVAIDQRVGHGSTSFLLGFAVATAALYFGAREFRRPSHDRMLDWLVASLPVVAYARFAPWGYVDFVGVATHTGVHRVVTIAVLLAAGSALLVAGLRRRRHAPLIGFLGCVAGVAVELRIATGLATEYWLLACGLVALLTAAFLDRWLRQPRHGLTSVPPKGRDSPLDLLQTAGAAILAQRSAPEPVTEDDSMSGGGGRFGGGGASGSY